MPPSIDVKSKSRTLLPTALDASTYRVADVDRISTPCILVYPKIIAENLASAIQWADGDPKRLRPHVKTHKTIEIARMALDRGIAKHKCATLVEAKMLAEAGVRDILVSYPMVGPNIERFVGLVRDWPDVAFSVIADHPQPVAELSRRLEAIPRDIEVLVDVDSGMGRTGVPLGPSVVALMDKFAKAPRIRLGGLHVYDGHVESPDADGRHQAVAETRQKIRDLVATIRSRGLDVPRIVVGGSGSFHFWLEQSREDPIVEGSPGTFVFSDWNYHQRYPDYRMQPAAVVLTRVISKPRSGRITLDAGHKAVAADKPAADRLWFFELSRWEILRHNEEHLVLDTPDADRFHPGDVLYALPYHVCPTIALYRDLNVVEDGKVTGAWRVAARDRG